MKFDKPFGSFNKKLRLQDTSRRKTSCIQISCICGFSPKKTLKKNCSMKVNKIKSRASISLLLVFLITVYSAIKPCQSVFLRLPGHLIEENNKKQLSQIENDYDCLYKDYYRKRRSLNIYDNAKTFGQSQNEMQRVQYYMQRLRELNEAKHPPSLFNEKKDGTTNGSVSSKSRLNEQNDDLNQQLNSWNRKRMLDHTSKVPEENNRFFEGDIVLTGDQAEQMYERAVSDRGGGRFKRKFIGSNFRRWDAKKPIFYSFDGSHTLREQKVIELALEHWHNITCLNFIRKNDEPKGNRIVFTDVDGCASNVGKNPLEEPQFVSLAPECIRLGVIAHEVAHALGFWHEQSRPDRDFFVNVRWDNIDRDSKGQFLKEKPAEVDNGGVPYDYGSIMHYRSKAFAKYDDLLTMSTFISDYQRTIGQRDQLSFNDIRLMNTIYCRDTCKHYLPCQRGGYTDPRHCDRCRCPDGFTGKLCEEIMPGYGAKCGGRLELTSGSQWQKISSPGYPKEFNEGQECSWLIVASRGQYVQLQFIGEFEMYCKVRHSLCMDYVEIRNSTNFANTGMRYCCFGTPTGSVVSATEDLLVLFRSFYRGGKGFQAQVRAIPQTGRWTEWRELAPCSASCGACGVRQRRRLCVPPSAFCLGDDTETEVCNQKPCKGVCTRNRIEDSDCTGFLSLLKGVRCKIEKTRLEECNEICCAGFSLKDGLCSRDECKERQKGRNLITKLYLVTFFYYIIFLISRRQTRNKLKKL